MSDPMETRLRAIVAPLLGLEPPDVPLTENLVHLGLSSLDVMRVSGRLRREGISVDLDLLIGEPTLAAWCRHVESADAAGPR
ncbi:phosphopantetheine-binding protein [Solwaraspora sp. WMMB335]|uniref:phosphopantetheine-binding protein n=1 Tax=Solwaraspora sp. WMMB335 TaxID=3404118 RepID=UPI003B94D875